jgi:hypothetical protein
MATADGAVLAFAARVAGGAEAAFNATAAALAGPPPAAANDGGVIAIYTDALRSSAAALKRHGVLVEQAAARIRETPAGAPGFKELVLGDIRCAARGAKDCATGARAWRAHCRLLAKAQASAGVPVLLDAAAVADPLCDRICGDVARVEAEARRCYAACDLATA